MDIFSETYHVRGVHPESEYIADDVNVQMDIYGPHSRFIAPMYIPSPRKIQRHLRQLDLHAKLVYSHQAYLDVLPMRASKGLAIRYLAMKWSVQPEALLVAGDSGNDEEMLSGNTLGVVVGNYSPELERLRGRPRIYFAEGKHAWGVLEGMEHYNFLGQIRISEEELPEEEARAL